MAKRMEQQEDAGATEGARRATGVAPDAAHQKRLGNKGRPDPEVPPKARRRRFTAKYKLRLLKEAAKCTKPGQLGALLRREGLYSSHLTTWRQQRERGELDGLAPKKRGRKRKPANPLASRVAELERENERLGKKLRQAETVIEVQKKVSDLLGIQVSNDTSEGGT